MKVIKGVIFAAILIYAAVSDIRTREVSDAVPIMITITAFIGQTTGALPGMLFAAIVITIPQLIVVILKPGSYGGADIKIIPLVPFFLAWDGLLAIIVGLTTGLLITVLS